MLIKKAVTMHRLFYIADNCLIIFLPPAFLPVLFLLPVFLQSSSPRVFSQLFFFERLFFIPGVSPGGFFAGGLFFFFF